MSSAEAKQLPQNHISQPTSSRGQDKSVLKLAPGIILSAVAAIAAIIAGKLLPGLSVLLIAIVLGVILCNVLTLPAIFSPGIAFTQKTLLRAGVVLLGYQLLISDVLGLGAGMIVTVIAIVGLGIAGTLFLGKLLSVEPTQRLLIACGFSICGAAAVAAVDGVVQVKDRKQVMTAVALVVIFGTTMIPLIPALTQWLGLSEAQGGMWAGGSIHEVAQAVAAGGAMGATALSLAAVVKLARVLMLAPVMAIISVKEQNKRKIAGEKNTGRRPALVPLFVLGFIAAMLLRSSGIMPEQLSEPVKVAQNFLLAAAMFALGTGVAIKSLLHIGFKPFLLAACSTVLVASLALGGILLTTH